jgi:hemerythrin-like domain-containing protein
MIFFSKTAPSFDHPLEMLLACHGKILQQCDTLRKLSLRLTMSGCDVQVQQAAAGILRYFDTAGQFHHQDEEENLFPALRNCPSVNIDLLQKLLFEHISLLSVWHDLRKVLIQLSAGENVLPETTLIEEFINCYTKHIITENNELLPLAARLLSEQQLALIGRKMAERRGVKLPGFTEY